MISTLERLKASTKPFPTSDEVFEFVHVSRTLLKRCIQLDFGLSSGTSSRFPSTCIFPSAIVIKDDSSNYCMGGILQTLALPALHICGCSAYQELG